MFVAFRQDMLGEMSQDYFKTLLASIKVEDHLPLQRFLLPPSHLYLLDELHAKHMLKERRAIGKAKAMEKAQSAKSKRTAAKKRPAAAAAAEKRKRSGKKWICDHWRAWRITKMPCPTENFRRRSLERRQIIA